MYGRIMGQLSRRRRYLKRGSVPTVFDFAKRDTATGHKPGNVAGDGTPSPSAATATHDCGRGPGRELSDSCIRPAKADRLQVSVFGLCMMFSLIEYGIAIDSKQNIIIALPFDAVAGR